MKTLIIYDTYFNNTELIAQSVFKALEKHHEARILNVKDATKHDLEDVELLIVGSPTRAFRPTKDVVNFLNGLSARSLKDVKVAAFDTRIALEDIDSKFLAFMAKLFGYAAKPINDQLKKKGGEEILAPEGFLVTGEKGPLKSGEESRASSWISQVLY
jgi:flavodoxin